LDTNILVRYLTQDDPDQSKLANHLMESLSSEAPAYISLVVITELVWVLLGPYQASKPQVIHALQQLLRTSAVLVERADLVWQALQSYEAVNADFSDCLIARLGMSAACSRTLTFDQKAAKLEGMKLLKRKMD
jgi:predicted nucleic-acid-binding protein